MALRDQVRRLKKELSSELAWFPLRNGRKFYYDPLSPELFLHGCACLRAGHDADTNSYPPPPPVLQALCNAVDVEAAFGQLYPSDPPAKFVLFPYLLGELLENRRLVPRSMVAGGAGEPDDP